MILPRRTVLALTASALVAPAAFAQPAPDVAPTSAAPTPAARLGASGDGYFIDWLNDFYPRALAGGAPREVIDQALAGVAPDPRVLAHDTAQPEFSRPVSDYVKGQVNAARIAAGLARRDSIPQFAGIEAQFGCPRDILLGVWALESNFGQIQGQMDIVRCLATLAALGRRRPWAEHELLAAFQILASGRAPSTRLLGSWAGAMGQTQMLPSTYLEDGVDADGDGRIDIWTSAPDALASAANLLAKGGWRRGEGWAREVLLTPGFDYALNDGPRQTPDWWAQQGAVRADGVAWSGADAVAPCVLLLPCGARGPAFLALPNHFAIRKYNNSLAYALAVGLLADGFGGAAPLVTPWPAETPLSLEDRLAAQGALARLGYDPGALDGVIGTNARAALKAWQKAQGLTADGYLTPSLIAQLKAQAGA